MHYANQRWFVQQRMGSSVKELQSTINITPKSCAEAIEPLKQRMATNEMFCFKSGLFIFIIYDDVTFDTNV